MVSEAAADIEVSGPNSEKAGPRWFDSRYLLDRCLGNAELANRVLARFRSSLDETVKQIELLAGQGEWTLLAKGAHRFKGEAGNIGCRPLAELASRVEEACGRGEAARPAVMELASAAEFFSEKS